MNTLKGHSPASTLGHERGAVIRQRGRPVRRLEGRAAVAPIPTPRKVTSTGARPIGHVIGHGLGELPASPRPTRPVGHVLGRAPGMVPPEVAAAGRPVGHVLGRATGLLPA
jgi:hypothetical protein